MSHSSILTGEQTVSQPIDALPKPSNRRLPWIGVWARRVAPTTAVIAMLAGLAWWGHSTEWKLPKFSSLVGGENTAEVANWCSDHNVPEDQCIECRANLVPLPKDYGWCPIHGISQCPFEHPELAQTKEVPEVSEADLERAARALELMPRPENRSVCKLHERRIQFASVEAIEKAGVDIAVVQPRPLVEAVVANGEIVYDATRTAELASRVSGSVWRIEKQIGDRVRAGEILAFIDSAAVGEAKTSFLQAMAQLRLRQTNLQRLQPLADVVSGRQMNDAVSAQEEARIQLLGAQQVLANLGLNVRIEDMLELEPTKLAERINSLGLPAEVLHELGPQLSASNLFPLCAPIDGVVVERNVTRGEVVDTDLALFRIADVSRMWLVLDVRQDDVNYLSLGQKVLFRPSGGASDSEIEGAVAWMSTEADDETRTVKVRVNLPNTDGRLRANTFGAGRIVLREESQALLVPSESVHWDGCCHIVFVRDKRFFQKDSPKFFHVRKVRVGVKDGDLTEIIAGVMPGEVVAGKNSVVLEAQLLKSNLGAGCCELDAPMKK